MDLQLPQVLRIRIPHGEDVAMGPGKAALLEAIRETGSISAAGRQLEMSYRKAWLLVDQMNRCFRSPLVEAAKGGSGGGGARLTPAGAEALKRYRAMEAKLWTILKPELKAFEGLMADRPE